MSVPLVLQNILSGPGSTEEVRSVGPFTMFGASSFLGVSVSPTSPDIADGATITPTHTVMRFTAATDTKTGLLMAAGSYDGQLCLIVNEGTATATMTFASQGTSLVADGANVIVGLQRATLLVYCRRAALWYALQQGT